MFSFLILVLVFDLLTCYFAGVVWCALVSVVDEYQFLGELLLF